MDTKQGLVAEGLHHLWKGEWQDAPQCPPPLVAPGQEEQRKKWEERKQKQKEVMQTSWHFIADALKDPIIIMVRKKRKKEKEKKKRIHMSCACACACTCVCVWNMLVMNEELWI